MVKQILAISCFYKRDKPEGIGLTLTRDYGDLRELARLISEMYQDQWNRQLIFGDANKFAQALIKQLDEIGLQRDFRDFQQVLQTFGAIWLLQQVGKIPTDDFNGIMIAREE